MPIYDIGELTGVNIWKYWLILGIACFIIAIYTTRSALRTLPPSDNTKWDFEENSYSVVWGLFLAVITITYYAGTVNIDPEIRDQLNIVLTVQLAINLFWSLAIDEESAPWLFYTQLLLAVTVLWLMKIFWKISKFGFWICVLYFCTILFETYRIYRDLP